MTIQKNKIYRKVYFGPAVIVGQLSGVQNSVSVPYSRLTWLKKSTAAMQNKLVRFNEIIEFQKHQRFLHDSKLSPRSLLHSTIPEGKNETWQVQVKVKKKEKGITIHSKPFINVLSRRQPHSFPKVPTAKSGIYVLSELCSLQTERKCQGVIMA